MRLEWLQSVLTMEIWLWTVVHVVVQWHNQRNILICIYTIINTKTCVIIRKRILVIDIYYLWVPWLKN
jgi:hypothetical protein